MSDGGISIGGPGGLTPGKSEISKSLSELGPAKESDVLQFQSALEGGQQPQPTEAAKPGNVTEPTGPFDFHVSSGTLVTPKQDLGKALIDYSKDISAISSNQTEALNKKLSEASSKGFNQADAIELQMMTFEMTSLVEIVSKGVGKVVTGLQTIIKQQ